MIDYCIDIDVQNLDMLDDFQDKEELKAFYAKQSDEIII